MLSTSLIKRKWRKLRAVKEGRRAAVAGITISPVAVPAFLSHLGMGSILHLDITRALFYRKGY
jgi:hypothetical protein